MATDDQIGEKAVKVLVTGVAGQLGHDVMNELIQRKYDAMGSDIKEKYSGIHDNTPVEYAPYVQLDITDKDSVTSVIKEYCPDIVIHCAAWTAVDLAEEKREVAYLVNAAGTRNIAESCRALKIKMMYISTDYVFDGNGDTPWQPDCKAFAPLNVYGETKLEGEKAVASLLEHYFIVRIAWVFGKSGNNFIKTMLKIGKTHDELRVVNDQVGTPTYTYDLARLLVDMIETEKYGYYHVTNEGGFISWYEFAKEIFRQAAEMGHPEYDEKNLKVVPVTTAEYGISKAKRPFNSRLDKSKLVREGFEPLPGWKDALHRYLQEIDFGGDI